MLFVHTLCSGFASPDTVYHSGLHCPTPTLLIWAPLIARLNWLLFSLFLVFHLYRQISNVKYEQESRDMICYRQPHPAFLFAHPCILPSLFCCSFQWIAYLLWAAHLSTNTETALVIIKHQKYVFRVIWISSQFGVGLNQSINDDETAVWELPWLPTQKFQSWQIFFSLGPKKMSWPYFKSLRTEKTI